MIRRVFSRETYNGFYLVSLKGEGEDPNPVGLFKKSTEKDEHGFNITEDDQPKCPNAGKVNVMARPWGEFIIVPSLCQRCIWVYNTRDNDYDCLLKTKEKIKPIALVNGGN